MRNQQTQSSNYVLENNKVQDENKEERFVYKKVPVITTSVRFDPIMRALYLPPALSLPLPYEGKGLMIGHSFISYSNSLCTNISNSNATE